MRLTLPGVAAAIGAAALVLSAQPAAAEQPSENSPLAQCMEAAAERDIDRWLCVGGTLHITTGQTENGTPTTETEVIAPDGEPKVTQAPPAKVDDYDTWCEQTASTCTREINLYTSETKWNLGYGLEDEDGIEVIGNFDMVTRTNFNGHSPRFNSSFIWDEGPGLTFYGAQIRCWDENWGPDFGCGTYYVDNGNGSFIIGPDDFRDDGPLINGEPLSGQGPYYADMSGSFTINGRPDLGAVVLAAGLETARWSCPTSASRSCYFP